MKREVKVEDAIGLRLAHDMTRIVPGKFKGAAFKLGHVVSEEDVPLLLDMGKRHIYVLDLDENELHENDGAQRMAEAVAGRGLEWGTVDEGKVILKSRHDGMVWVDEQKVQAMNEIDDIAVITRSPYTHVNAGTSVAGVRPIPLIIERTKIEEIERIAGSPEHHPLGHQASGVIDVIPYQSHKAALVSTGSEIASGRIEDKFGPTLRTKFSEFGVEVISQTFPGDEFPDIVKQIKEAAAKGATIICVTGGMSVDPDDRSPAAIRAAADNVVSYGAPVLPGSMSMVAYLGKTVILGLPGAVMYDNRTTFDVLLPRILAGVEIRKTDIAKLGVGGWLNA